MRAALQLPARVHGGPDVLGVPLHDFSTNSNACGPCPAALSALAQADASRYPDARYAALRHALADFHRVDPARLVLAGSASEFIFRFTAWAARRGAQRVAVPTLAYGDYAQAALAHGLAVQRGPAGADLHWACDPASPLGVADAAVATLPALAASGAHVVLDRAYEPLRLAGRMGLGVEALDRVWQLWTPNKALGLTGVRAAYAIAPGGAADAVHALDALCPSWPIGAHGVALLQAWCARPAQAWLTGSLTTLRAWKQRQVALCDALGWQCLPSDANFFGARPAAGVDAAALCATLRAQGIKLRDTTSFGLTHHVRLSVQPPGAQDALAAAVKALA